jgi:hypothetical protein
MQENPLFMDISPISEQPSERAPSPAITGQLPCEGRRQLEQVLDDPLSCDQTSGDQPSGDPMCNGNRANPDVIISCGHLDDGEDGASSATSGVLNVTAEVHCSDESLNPRCCELVLD